MIGMAGRGRVVLRLLWLLVRDEVSESSRGPGVMVSQRQKVKQYSSLASLGRRLLDQGSMSSIQMFNVARKGFHLLTRMVKVRYLS